MRMFRRTCVSLTIVLGAAAGLAAESPRAFPPDPQQHLERTCFQTASPWSGIANLRSDVAIVYGVDPALPQRIQTWRDRGYLIHVMTGVSWGNYQDYLYARFDGVNHEDEAQTDAAGNKISHGGDVYYMCPGTNYGKFLCRGIQRALDAGAEAVHLEEPEFWVRGGYSEGFKREWKSYYGEDWQPPHSSVDAQWRSARLKYYLYRRALQQVFDYVQDDNRRTGRKVRCYVPSHSLLSYAHWRIVSPESSLAGLVGCDGYIAQVWTGTARTPNMFRGQLRERTFETAFLEYGAMMNLVRGTGRRVWFLNDPVEDNPDHDWNDYRLNWESTMVASLLQPDVWHFEVAPWPERVFGGQYPKPGKPGEREPMPPAYATEVQTVCHALNDMNQRRVEWDCGTTGIGLVISDSLMFQRGEPGASDPHLGHVYGLALPLLKRGMPVTPVQLENVTLPDYLEGFRVLLLSYHGMKPLIPEVHPALAAWVRRGGVLVMCDDDKDPYNAVREWWNSDGRQFRTPREDLFAKLGLSDMGGRASSRAHASAEIRSRGEDRPPGQDMMPVGKGAVIWMRENPAGLAASAEGDARLVAVVKQAARARLKWRETNYLLLRRGPYVLAAGLDESVAAEPTILQGRWVNLFEHELRVHREVTLAPGSRFFLLDLEAVRGRRARVLASACKALPVRSAARSLSLMVEGVASTPGVVLLRSPSAPRSVTLAGQPLSSFQYSAPDRLLWIRFLNEAAPRELALEF
ncbi:MAG TPA: hypothetical protein PLU91_05100 [Verrucomicrobiota bacterium]|jgi:hypothetical protein|nr:hypothetical protein [Verrucomicrobiota bacterium]